MTPDELNRWLTGELKDLLLDTGFRKKRIRCLCRKTEACEQTFTFYFTRDRGLPGNSYSLTATLGFSFPEVNQLTDRFLGDHYNANCVTGAQPLYAVMGRPMSKCRDCDETSLRRFAEQVADDFRSFALPFYGQYDTVEKLEAAFRQHSYRDLEDEFSVVRFGAGGSGTGCCIAASLCVLAQWDQLQLFLRETDLLLPEQRERITQYLAE